MSPPSYRPISRCPTRAPRSANSDPRVLLDGRAPTHRVGVPILGRTRSQAGGEPRHRTSNVAELLCEGDQVLAMGDDLPADDEIPLDRPGTDLRPVQRRPVHEIDSVIRVHPLVRRGTIAAVIEPRARAPCDRAIDPSPVADVHGFTVSTSARIVASDTCTYRCVVAGDACPSSR